MGKNLAFFVIILGLSLVGNGIYKFFTTYKETQNSLAEAYNIVDTTEREVISEQPFDFSPKHGDTVGLLEIPKINGKLPIIEGSEEDELERGVGHFKGTAYPAQNDQIVLSGHRDTVFRRMGELEIGDTITIHLPYGTFSYKIAHTKIVDADNRTVIKTTFPKEELILSTCYPFSFVGNAPERYVITAYPVK